MMMSQRRSRLCVALVLTACALSLVPVVQVLGKPQVEDVVAGIKSADLAWTNPSANCRLDTDTPRYVVKTCKSDDHNNFDAWDAIVNPTFFCNAWVEQECWWRSDLRYEHVPRIGTTQKVDLTKAPMDSHVTYRCWIKGLDPASEYVVKVAKVCGTSWKTPGYAKVVTKPDTEQLMADPDRFGNLYNLVDFDDVAKTLKFPQPWIAPDCDPALVKWRVAVKQVKGPNGVKYQEANVEHCDQLDVVDGYVTCPNAALPSHAGQFRFILYANLPKKGKCGASTVDNWHFIRYRSYVFTQSDGLFKALDINKQVKQTKGIKLKDKLMWSQANAATRFRICSAQLRSYADKAVNVRAQTSEHSDLVLLELAWRIYDKMVRAQFTGTAASSKADLGENVMTKTFRRVILALVGTVQEWLKMDVATITPDTGHSDTQDATALVTAIHDFASSVAKTTRTTKGALTKEQFDQMVTNIVERIPKLVPASEQAKFRCSTPYWVIQDIIGAMESHTRHAARVRVAGSIISSLVTAGVLGTATGVSAATATALSAASMGASMAASFAADVAGAVLDRSDQIHEFRRRARSTFLQPFAGRFLIGEENPVFIDTPKAQLDMTENMKKEVHPKSDPEIRAIVQGKCLSTTLELIREFTFMALYRPNRKNIDGTIHDCKSYFASASVRNLGIKHDIADSKVARYQNLLEMVSHMIESVTIGSGEQLAWNDGFGMALAKLVQTARSNLINDVGAPGAFQLVGNLGSSGQLNAPSPTTTITTVSNPTGGQTTTSTTRFRQIGLRGRASVSGQEEPDAGEHQFFGAGEHDHVWPAHASADEEEQHLEAMLRREQQEIALLQG